MDKIETLIITRFNLSLKMNTQNVFDIERLNTRLELFKTFPFQSLKGQTDQNFRWIILYDKMLPTIILEGLRGIVDSCQNIILFEYKGWNLGDLNPYFPLLTSNYCLTIRLDDDDALEKNFIYKIRRRCEQNKNGLLLISCPQGYFWKYDKEPTGKFYRQNYKLIALGLALLVDRRKFPITAYYHCHTKWLDLLGGVLKDTNNKIHQMARSNGMSEIGIKHMVRKGLYRFYEEQGVYIRSIHSDNDGSVNKKSQKVGGLIKLRDLAKDYTLDISQLKLLNSFLNTRVRKVGDKRMLSQRLIIK